jgi:hypothetical protein
VESVLETGKRFSAATKDQKMSQPENTVGANICYVCAYQLITRKEHRDDLHWEIERLERLMDMKLATINVKLDDLMNRLKR